MWNIKCEHCEFKHTDLVIVQEHLMRHHLYSHNHFRTCVRQQIGENYYTWSVGGQKFMTAKKLWDKGLLVCAVYDKGLQAIIHVKTSEVLVDFSLGVVSVETERYQGIVEQALATFIQYVPYDARLNREWLAYLISEGIRESGEFPALRYTFNQ